MKKGLLWFDNTSVKAGSAQDGISWFRITPFIALHLACFFAFWTGASWTAIAIFGATYFIRMFAITAFYHRYFSHRTFSTSRFIQTVFAFFGAASGQRGPLWWTAHHRHHHTNSDTTKDVHAPKYGFWKSHLLWFLQNKNFSTRSERIKDWVKFPALRLIDRFDIASPVIFAVLVLLLGMYLEGYHPELGATTGQVLVWGFFISTIAVCHATFCINSLAHLWGTRRFATKDDSRNNFFLAVLTLGEGWHNNHHKYPGSVKQGIRWWEVDVSYYVLKLFEKLGLIWDVRYQGVESKR